MKQLEAWYSFQLHDQRMLVMDSRRRPAHSFTKQFAQLLFNSFPFYVSPASPIAMTDTSGASKTVFSTGSTTGMFWRVDAPTANATFGILVGTSTAAESINDTALGTKIAHGTGAGQLQYGTVTFAAPSTTATTTTFRVTRVFTNGSGGSIVVQEIGLAVGNTAAGAYLLLILRDLTGAVTVNNGQQLTVNYDFTTTI